MRASVISFDLDGENLQSEENESTRTCASIDSNNQGSFNAYLKAGFKLEAKLKKYFLHDSHISKNYSDKLYVTIDNLEYDIEKFKKSACKALFFCL